MNRENIVSEAGFSWELNKFDLGMLMSLRTLWRPPVSLSIQIISFYNIIQSRC